MIKETFSFPASVQSDLFGYLKPHQQAILKPYLRIVKRPYQEKLCTSLLDYLEGHGLDTLSEPVLALFQEELCISLMDYLEGNGLNPVSQPVLRSLQQQIIEECKLHPLTTRQPKSIGTIVKQLFPSFSGRNNSPIL